MSDHPTIRSLKGALVDRAAAGVLAKLDAERAAGRLYLYRRPGLADAWNVFLEDVEGQVVAVPHGGVRLTLEEWALTVYPVHLAAHRREQQADPGAREATAEPGAPPATPGQSPPRRLRWKGAGGSLLTTMRTHARRLRLLVFTLALVGVLPVGVMACDLGPTGGGTGGTTFTPASVTPHRGPITVVYCPEHTGKYPAALFKQANAYMADTLEKAVVPNQDGVTAFIEPITSTTYDDTASGAFTIQVPKTDPMPPPPSLQATPTPDATHVYDSGLAQKQANDANAKAIQDYNAALARERDQLRGARALVTQGTDRLRAFSPPPDPNGKDASVWGCALKASERLAHVDGQKWLVFCSAMDETLWSDARPLQLSGVTTRVLFYYSQTSSFAAYKQATWERALHQGGVTDLAFVDPQASSVLPPLFGGA